MQLNRKIFTGIYKYKDTKINNKTIVLSFILFALLTIPVKVDWSTLGRGLEKQSWTSTSFVSDYSQESLTNWGSCELQPAQAPPQEIPEEVKEAIKTRNNTNTYPNEEIKIFYNPKNTRYPPGFLELVQKYQKL